MHRSLELKNISSWINLDSNEPLLWDRCADTRNSILLRFWEGNSFFLTWIFYEFLINISALIVGRSLRISNFWFSGFFSTSSFSAPFVNFFFLHVQADRHTRARLPALILQIKLTDINVLNTRELKSKDKRIIENLYQALNVFYRTIVYCNVITWFGVWNLWRSIWSSKEWIQIDLKSNIRFYYGSDLQKLLVNPNDKYFCSVFNVNHIKKYIYINHIYCSPILVDIVETV